MRLFPLIKPAPGWILVSSTPESSLGIWRKFFELLIPRNIDEHPTNLDPSAVPGWEHLPRGRCGRCPGASFGHSILWKSHEKRSPEALRIFNEYHNILTLFSDAPGTTAQQPQSQDTAASPPAASPTPSAVLTSIPSQNPFQTGHPLRSKGLGIRA